MTDTRDSDRRHDRVATIRLAILVAFVALPAANYHAFDGIPFDSLPEYLLLLAIAPIVGWPWLRQRWQSALGRPSSRAVTIATVTVVIGVAAKCALFFGGGFAGFAGCYRALDEAPRAGLCERSYANPLGRFQATRVDREIDFAPTDWNLSFFNDNRFNYYNWIEGTIPRWRIPFSANWRRIVSHSADREIGVTYVGAGTITIGARRIELEPSYERPRTVDFNLPAGRQRLWIAYAFNDGARIGPTFEGDDRVQIATFRLQAKTAAGGAPLRAAPLRSGGESPGTRWTPCRLVSGSGSCGSMAPSWSASGRCSSSQLPARRL